MGYSTRRGARAGIGGPSPVVCTQQWQGDWAVCLELAEASGARLTLMLVVNPPHIVGVGAPDTFVVTKVAMSPATIAEAKHVLDGAALTLPAGEVERLVEIRRPADTLLDRAIELHADHIVVGARGRSAAGRWLLGSVSDRVVALRC